MDNTYNAPYIAALLSGLSSPPAWLKLTEGDEKVLEHAKKLLGYPTGVPKLAPLAAITGRSWGQSHNWYFNPAPFEGKNEDYLALQAPKPSLNQSQQDTLLNPLQNLQKPPQGSEKAFSYTLYHKVFQAGARLSLQGSKHDDVSVFDENRLLAATVACLCQRPEDNFILLKGAISGIQGFIYHEIGGEQIDDAKNTAKRLRGRSFMVAHLSQIIAEYLTDQLQLEHANILFVGGGHFNLLLPDTTDIHSKLHQLLKEINLELLQKVGIQLSLLMAWESATADKLFKEAGAVYAKLNEKLEHSKKAKHQSYLSQFFTDFEKFSERSTPIAAESYEDIGALVPKSDFIIEVLSSKSSSDPRKHKNHILRIFNRDYFLENSQNKVNPGASKVIFINHALSDNDLDPSTAYGFTFLGKEAPGESDTLLTFEQIAALNRPEEKVKLSYPQLAALRLDVDDLGALFTSGLGANTPLTRLASLSRECQLFFGGYMNLIAQRHDMYVVYSGGDDAFIIGSWMNAIHFAEDLYQEFCHFTCQNEYLSFSAGLFFCNPFYPVVRFADDAQQLEDRAKEYQKSAAGKNALCVFNQVITWQRYLELMEFTTKLAAVVPDSGEKAPDSHHLRRSMLQHLLKTIQNSRDDQFEFFRNIGRIHGLMSRHGYNKEKLDKRKDQAADIVRTLLTEARNPERFNEFSIPLQYILYKTRTLNP